MAENKKNIMAQEKTVEQLQAEVDQLKTELDAALKVNEELTAELEKFKPAEAPKAPDVKELLAKTFKYEKKSYGFNFPYANVDGSKVSTTDVCESKDLQQKLIEMGSGMLKEL